MHLLEITVDKIFDFRGAGGTGTGTTKVKVIDITRIVDAYIAIYGRTRSMPKKRKTSQAPACSSSDAPPPAIGDEEGQEEAVEREAAPESEGDSDTEEAMR